MTATITTDRVRRDLIEGREIALLDVREEGPFSLAHPLFAVSVPFGRIEIKVLELVPRLTVPVVVYDDGEGLAEPAAERLRRLGYTDVSLLEGGLTGWKAAGGEVYRDVNVPSKAFGELVETSRHTPSLPATAVKALIDSKADIVILDARRFEEYRTMSIPGGISVPGAELVYRVGEIAPSPDTLVIVNCAGRTRSIIGTQSLVNAGIPNRVAALRNGTIGWTIAGLTLDGGQTAGFRRSAARPGRRQAPPPAPSPTGPKSDASTAPRSIPGSTTATGRCSCSTCAIRRNTKPGISPASGRRPAVSSSRRPTTTSACAARGWCWRTTMASGPT